jgi:glutaconate CoA-transferase, subunit A
MMTGKVLGLADAVSLIHDGDVVGIGGGPLFAAPMALIHEIIRAGRRDLSLILAPRSGLAGDILLGAGCARALEFAQMTLEEYGLAPHFRRLAQAGAIDCREHT